MYLTQSEQQKQAQKDLSIWDQAQECNNYNLELVTSIFKTKQKLSPHSRMHPAYDQSYIIYELNQKVFRHFSKDGVLISELEIKCTQIVDLEMLDDEKVLIVILKEHSTRWQFDVLQLTNYLCIIVQWDLPTNKTIIKQQPKLCLSNKVFFFVFRQSQLFCVSSYEPQYKQVWIKTNYYQYPLTSPNQQELYSDAILRKTRYHTFHYYGVQVDQKSKVSFFSRFFNYRHCFILMQSLEGERQYSLNKKLLQSVPFDQQQQYDYEQGQKCQMVDIWELQPLIYYCSLRMDQQNQYVYHSAIINLKSKQIIKYGVQNQKYYIQFRGGFRNWNRLFLKKQNYKFGSYPPQYFKSPRVYIDPAKRQILKQLDILKDQQYRPLECVFPAFDPDWELNYQWVEDQQWEANQKSHRQS